MLSKGILFMVNSNPSFTSVREGFSFFGSSQYSISCELDLYSSSVQDPQTCLRLEHNCNELWRRSKALGVLFFFSFNRLHLTKNGENQVTAYGTESSFEHGSNSAALRLRRRDRVQLVLSQGTIYEHPDDEIYTSFSGFKL